MAALTITRSFAAPREAVFDAWTNPEKFAVWFGTDGVDVPAETLSMDVRPGGSWKAVMKLPDDTSISWVGEYLEVDAPSHLVMTITDNPALDAGAVGGCLGERGREHHLLRRPPDARVVLHDRLGVGFGLW